MKIKRHFLTLFLAMTLLSGHAFATLIGDQVSCSYNLDAGFWGVYGGPCSISDDAFSPGPAIVGDSILTDPEFYLGVDLPLGSGTAFFVGGELDIDADSITFKPLPPLTTFANDGKLVIDVGSLNWVGFSESRIYEAIASSSNFEGSLTVTHDDDSVRISIEASEKPQSDTRITVKLIPSRSVPIASTASLFTLGFCGLALFRGRAPHRE
ncbi:Uncharacterised protein [Halioglobus japonicus]|nr:Uncharacterised protein [Halioglobus japonicus]